MNIDDLMKEADQYGRSAWNNARSAAGSAWDATAAGANKAWSAAGEGLNRAKAWFNSSNGPPRYKADMPGYNRMRAEGLRTAADAASAARPGGARINLMRPSAAEGWAAWGKQPAGEAVRKAAGWVGEGAASTARALSKIPGASVVGGVAGGTLGTLGAADLGLRVVLAGAEKAGIAEPGILAEFDKTGRNSKGEEYSWYEPRGWGTAVQGAVRAGAYGVGRGLNAINSDWGITDDDVKYATRHGINIFDDNSGPKAREAQAKRHEALMKEMQQARDQGAPERGAVVGTAPEAKPQLVIPKDENGEATGAPYFVQPSIAPRLRDATAQEAASLPIGNKTRQTLDFGSLGGATFAYNPEREARIKESIKAGLYDQTPRSVAAYPDGKGGFTPSEYATNPTDPARAAQGAADVEAVRRGTLALQDLRAANLAQERGGVQAPPQADPTAMKALRAAMAQGQAPSKAAEPKAEKQPDMFNVLKQMVGDEKLAGRIMMDAAAAGLQPKNLRDLAIMTQAWQQRGDIMPPDAAPHANRFDYQVAAGEAPGWFDNGGLTVASRRSGRPVDISAGDMPPDTYYELLKRAGIEP